MVLLLLPDTLSSSSSSWSVGVATGDYIYRDVGSSGSGSLATNDPLGTSVTQYSTAQYSEHLSPRRIDGTITVNPLR